MASASSSTAPPSLLTPATLLKVVHYVHERRHADGAFGLTALSPATVSDTFYAVRILEILRREAGWEKTRAYVAGIDWSISTRAQVLYQLAYLRHKFGLPCLPPWPTEKKVSLSLEEAYFRQKISYLTGNPFDLAPTAPLEIPCPPTLPKSFTLKELCYYLFLQPPQPDAATAAQLAWVQACQTPDGGFGFRPGTTSFMDNVLPAVKILTRFHQPPKDLAGLVNFILSCQTRDGGFARKNGGVAFLESTYQAVRTLELLKCL